MVLLFKQIFGKDFIHTAKFATKNTDNEEEPQSQQRYNISTTRQDMLVFQLQSQEGIKGQENKKINFQTKSVKFHTFFFSDNFPKIQAKYKT